MATPTLANHHWALIADACGITVAGTFTLGVLTQHWTVGATLTAAMIMLILGSVVLVVTLALHAAYRVAVAIGLWSFLAFTWPIYAHFHQHVWSYDTWRWLAIASLLLTGWTIIAANDHLKPEPAPEPVAPRPETTSNVRIEALFAQCNLAGIRVTSAGKTERGRECVLVLPANGRVTIRTLQAAADGLAAAMRVAPDAISFEQGQHAGEVIMRVDDRNSLAVDVPYPHDGEQLTVHSQLGVGVKPSSQTATIDPKMSTMVTGVTGSGKTNVLNVLIAQLTRCPEVIMCVIDLNGGRLAAPWIRPWVEGRCPRPAIDWVATTRAEAVALLKAIDALITMRGSNLVGGAAKFKATPTLPQFVIITDEMADLTGNVPRAEWEGTSPSEISELGAKLTRKARSEGVTLIWATQKGTVDFTGSSAIKSQCKQRISLATASESDARAVTDNHAVVRLLAAATHIGSMVIENLETRAAVLIKAWRLDGDDDAAMLDRLAEQAGQTPPRPEPDPGALEALGAAYADRWENSSLYQLLLQDFHDRTGNAPLAPPSAAPAAEPNRATTAIADIDVNSEAARLLDSIGLGSEKPEPSARMWALLADARSMGLSQIEIKWKLDSEGLSVHKSTIYRWLNEAEKTGKVRRTGGDGDAARWVLT